MVDMRGIGHNEPPESNPVTPAKGIGRHVTPEAVPLATIAEKSGIPAFAGMTKKGITWPRSEEHTSELQSLMRISYAVFCLKKNKTKTTPTCSRSPHMQSA